MNSLKNGINKMKAFHRKRKIDKIRKEKVENSMNDFYDVIKNASEEILFNESGVSDGSAAAKMFENERTMAYGDNTAYKLPRNIVMKDAEAIFPFYDEEAGKQKELAYYGNRIKFINTFGETTNQFQYDKNRNRIKVLPTDVQKEIGNEKQRDLTTSGEIAEYLDELKEQYQFPNGTTYRHREIVLANINLLLNWAENNQNN